MGLVRRWRVAAGRGDFERFRFFAAGFAAQDHAVDDAGEVASRRTRAPHPCVAACRLAVWLRSAVGGGDDAPGLAEARFEDAAELADVVEGMAAVFSHKPGGSWRGRARTQGLWSERRRRRAGWTRPVRVSP